MSAKIRVVALIAFVGGLLIGGLSVGLWASRPLLSALDNETLFQAQLTRLRIILDEAYRTGCTPTVPACQRGGERALRQSLAEIEQQYDEGLKLATKMYREREHD